jgi:hypothetical protein
MRGTLIPLRCKPLLSSRFDLTIQPAPDTLEKKHNFEFVSDPDLQRSEKRLRFSVAARTHARRRRKYDRKDAIAASAASHCSAA